MSDKLKTYLGALPYTSIISFGEEEDKAAAEKVAADKIAADKIAADKVIADKAIADKAAADKIAEDARTKKVDVNIKVEVPKVEAGKTYTAEETQKMIQEAVKAGATTTKNQLHEELKKLQEKVDETEALLKDNPESSKLNEQNAELKTKLKILEDEITKVVISNETIASERHTEKLEAHKATLIADAEGRIVKEVFAGCNTIEELDEAAKVGIAKYEEYSERLRKEYKIPKVEVPKKGTDEEQDGEISVDRIDPRDPASIKEFESKRKQVTDKIWDQYLIK